MQRFFLNIYPIKIKFAFLDYLILAFVQTFSWTFSRVDKIKLVVSIQTNKNSLILTTSLLINQL
jgi:hypothetical protein